MIESHPCRAVFAAGLALVFSFAGARAETSADLVPTDLPITLAGSYLAGRSADAAQDVEAAATFFTNALKSDPDNPALMERILILRLAIGEIDDGFTLAEKLIVADPRNPLARLSLGVKAIKTGAFETASKQLNETAEAPLATLTAGLLEGWVDQATNKVDDGLKTIDGLSGPAWYGIFKDYHHALIADVSGRKDDAVAAITRAYKADSSALRIVEGYARILARAGKPDDAIKALTKFIAETPSHPSMSVLLADLQAGKTPDPVVSTPQQGAAEVLYGLGAAIGTDEGSELPAAYLRLSSYLDSTANLPLLALGDLFLGAKRYEDAVTTYSKVPDSSPLHRSAEIQIGSALDALDKVDDAAARVKKIVDADPSDLEAVVALGNIYRGHERFSEAAAAYSRGIATIANPAKTDWRIYYFRGVSLEQAKRWPEAEADLSQALTINPDQPQVLNYLGYSWVDQGEHLDKALGMIKTAVDLRPNDGYIVDSLGWAYFKLGRFDDAARELEHAVELKADDPVINEHYGDALWKVGRKRDAVFQWMHSRDLNPEKDALPKILAKIDGGIDAKPAEPATPPAAAAATPPPAEGTKTETAAVTTPAAVGAPAAASSVTVAKGESLWSISLRVYGNADLYERILKANRGHIRNPDKIFPGMTLTIPAKD